LQLFLRDGTIDRRRSPGHGPFGLADQSLSFVDSFGARSSEY
jgi:hypothetical protein